MIPEQLQETDSRFIAAGGLQVHYKQAGAGAPAVVLLHGFGASIFSWRDVLGAPAGLGTLYAYDRPAFGLTERRPDYDFSPENQVELTVALLDAWGIRQAVLVGHSAGGTIALMTALRHPERIAGLVLVDAAVYMGGGAPPIIKPFLATRPGTWLGTRMVRGLKQRFVKMLINSYYDPALVTPAVLAGYSKVMQIPGWDRALWQLTLASHASNLPPHLHKIKQPALVITGANDRIVPAAQSRRLAAELPAAQYIEFPECGHLPQEECPRAFLAALQSFISGLP